MDITINIKNNGVNDISSTSIFDILNDIANIPLLYMLANA